MAVLNKIRNKEYLGIGRSMPATNRTSGRGGDESPKTSKSIY